jgi:aspartyl-tRNA(Asn)/glutamyl-tRNA(Gln) amidotransferase subunit C
MRIDEAQIRHLASLAQIEIDPAELPGLQRDLDAILTYVEALTRVDTTGVPPSAQDARPTPLRPDEPGAVLSVEEVVRVAPRSDGGALVVPRVVE